jgi:hypothetical protein
MSRVEGFAIYNRETEQQLSKTSIDRAYRCDSRGIREGRS